MAKIEILFASVEQTLYLNNYCKILCKDNSEKAFGDMLCI